MPLVVIRQLTEQPVATPLFYQKHMTKHMPAGMDMGWCAAMRHCFLIRDPAEVIASYLKKMPSVDEHDIGIARQAELFREISAVTGEPPCVIDAADVLRNPDSAMASLCKSLGVEYLTGEMLSWPPGRRESDGVWARLIGTRTSRNPRASSVTVTRCRICPENIGRFAQVRANTMSG